MYRRKVGSISGTVGDLPEPTPRISLSAGDHPPGAAPPTHRLCRNACRSTKSPSLVESGPRRPGPATAGASHGPENIFLDKIRKKNFRHKKCSPCQKNDFHAAELIFEKFFSRKCFYPWATWAAPPRGAHFHKAARFATPVSHFAHFPRFLATFGHFCAGPLRTTTERSLDFPGEIPARSRPEIGPAPKKFFDAPSGSGSFRKKTGAMHSEHSMNAGADLR